MTRSRTCRPATLSGKRSGAGQSRSFRRRTAEGSACSKMSICRLFRPNSAVLSDGGLPAPESAFPESTGSQVHQAYRSLVLYS